MHLQKEKRGQCVYFYLRSIARDRKFKVYLGRLHTYRNKAILPATKAHEIAQAKGIPFEDFFNVKGLSVTIGRADMNLPEKARQTAHAAQVRALRRTGYSDMAEHWQGVCATVERVIAEGECDPWTPLEDGTIPPRPGPMHPKQKRYLMALNIKDIVRALDELLSHNRPNLLRTARPEFKGSMGSLMAALQGFNHVLSECNVKMHPFAETDWPRVTTRLTFDVPELPLFEDANLIKTFLYWLEDGGDDPRLACCKVCGNMFVKVPAQRSKCRPDCHVKRQAH